MYVYQSYFCAMGITVSLKKKALSYIMMPTVTIHRRAVTIHFVKGSVLNSIEDRLSTECNRMMAGMLRSVL